MARYHDRSYAVVVVVVGAHSITLQELFRSVGRQIELARLRRAPDVWSYRLTPPTDMLELKSASEIQQSLDVERTSDAPNTQSNNLSTSTDSRSI